MLVKLPDLPVLLRSHAMKKADDKQKCLACLAAPGAHLALGVLCAAMALPWGLKAAALAPVGIGFAKGLLDHCSAHDADPAHLAWVIAGAAVAVGAARMLGLG